MGDGTPENPLTQKDVLEAIKQNGGTAKGLDLSGKWFEEGIDLQGLNFEGIILRETILRSAHFERSVLSRAHLDGADLMESYLERAVLQGTNLEGTTLFDGHLEGANLRHANLEGAWLGRAKLQGASLFGAKFSTNTKLENADWGNYILGEENDGRNEFATNTYRQLKQWYTNAGMYDIAGNFFFREMTVKRKILKWRPNPLPRAWSKFISLICGYGERPQRVIAWASSVIVGLALIYYAIGTLTPGSFLDSLYYSAVSFTAVGYGNWAPTPTGWVKWLGAFEAFVGAFSIALFLVTFTRKMTR